MHGGPAKFSGEYWLERAEEARTIAEYMSHPETKRQMLGIAESYVRLADHVREEKEAAAATPAPE
jgi:hypothetical protein